MRINKLLTITAGTPLNIVTGLTATQMANFGPLRPVFCRSIFIQAAAGGTGEIYVMDGIYGVQADGVSPRIPATTNSSDVTATLAPATAGAPGGNYGDPNVQPNGATDIDATKCWIDGSHTSDTVYVSYTAENGTLL